MTELRASDTVAVKIRDARKARGWTMADLADHCPGLSANIIENIESGRRDADGRRRRDITIDELIIIAEALDVNVGSLLPERVIYAETHGWSDAARQAREKREARKREREMMIAKATAMLQQENERLRVLDKEMTAAMRNSHISQGKINEYRNLIEQLRAERD